MSLASHSPLRHKANGHLLRICRTEIELPRMQPPAVKSRVHRPAIISGDRSLAHEYRELGREVTRTKQIMSGDSNFRLILSFIKCRVKPYCSWQTHQLTKDRRSGRSRLFDWRTITTLLYCNTEFPRPPRLLPTNHSKIISKYHTSAWTKLSLHQALPLSILSFKRQA